MIDSLAVITVSTHDIVWRYVGGSLGICGSVNREEIVPNCRLLTAVWLNLCSKGNSLRIRRSTVRLSQALASALSSVIYREEAVAW